MRLLDLYLQAFGPFAGTALNLAQPGVLHLIFGPNEAGKSTALRAITGLLYGIPSNTPDAHRHAMRDLRIGARLAWNDERVMHVIRRKGNKNTLLGPDETPLPDDALSAHLGGVGESLFRSMFGLDHVTLRDGAQALLRGRGSVGESLFAAGFSGSGVHALLKQLENEASEIFKPRGQNPKLNEAIRLFKEADKRSRETATSADAYRTQQDAMRDAREESEQLTERRRDLTAEQNRLQRLLRVLPLLARRNENIARRHLLGEVVPLPDDAGRRRIAAETAIRECEWDRNRLRRDIDELEGRLAELQPAQAVLEVQEQAIKELQDRLGSDRKAETDLPGLEVQLRAAEEEALEILSQLGRTASLADVEALRIPAAQQARIRKLAQQSSGVEASLAEAQRTLAERRARQQKQRDQLSGLHPSGNVGPLQACLQRATRLGDIDGAIESARQEIGSLQDELRQKVRLLGLADTEPSGIRTLPLPAAESVERFAARFDAHDRDAKDVGTQRRECEERLRRVRRGLDELRLVGDVPSEDQLDEQRKRRDTTWRQMREHWEAGETADSRQIEAFEDDLRVSDDLADRLRREADRVATRAKLRAELVECEQEAAALEGEFDRITASEVELQADWVALWEPAGVKPRAPAEMRNWLVRSAAVVKLAEELEEQRAAVSKRGETRSRHRAEVCEALRTLGESAGEEDVSFESVVELSQRALEDRRARAARRTELARAIEEADNEIGGLELRHTECEQALETWKRAWEERITPLGLPSGADAVEALEVLDRLAELFSKMGNIRQLRRRVGGIERDRTRLSEDVHSLVQRHVPSLLGLSAADAGDRLVQAYHRAQSEHREREKIQEDLSSRRAELRECEQAAAGARATIEELRQLAKVDAVEDIERAEMVAVKAAELDAELCGIEEDLYQAGEGATIEQLVEQAGDVDPDAIRPRLAEIGSEIEEANDRRAELLQQIGSLEEGLKHLEAGERAADAAVEAQEYLATIKNGVSKYVRLRLGALLLHREIDRYRERAQGPLLLRANTLFPRLTLGRYASLRVGFDSGDEPVLRCVRHDGTELGVEELSDGTRDQLYLALRVATLEHHAESSEPMPVVLDDVLIHFDDTRAAAALGILAELAKHVQVLFFTHHAHLIELARATLPEQARVEHELHVVQP